MMDDTPALAHLHHITAIAYDAPRTVDFYTRTLGMRLVKRTVNFDDPTSYHLYFGCDAVGSPGGLITFFVWPNAPRGRPGIGTTHHVAFLTTDADAQDRWKRWLVDRGVQVTGPYDRHYFRSIYFTDPDGLILEIATAGPGFAQDEAFDELGSRIVLPPQEVTRGHRDEERIANTMASDPVDGIDEDMRLRSLHHVTCIQSDDRSTDDFYTEILGLRRLKVTVNYDDPAASHLYYGSADARPGGTITFFGYDRRRSSPGVIGIGTVHHIAYACSDDASQTSWRERLRERGLQVTPVMDRRYFRSIYFRDPAGVLLEIATIPPGFAVDEPEETLGQRLALPPWLEPRRAEIEHVLEPIG